MVIFRIYPCFLVTTGNGIIMFDALSCFRKIIYFLTNIGMNIQGRRYAWHRYIQW